MFRNIYRTLAVVSFAIIIWVQVSAGEGLFSHELSNRESGLLVDFATFYEADSSRIRLELYYKMYDRMLHFEKTDTGLFANYEITIRVRDEDGNLSGTYERSRQLRIDERAVRTRRNDFRINQVNFLLDQGKYEIEFNLRDKNTGEHEVRRLDAKLKFSDFKRRAPRLSDIEFVMVVGEVSETSSPFDKGNLTLVPSLEHEFGPDQNHRLKYYVEVYLGTDPLDEVQIENIITDRGGRLHYQDSLMVALDAPAVRQFREVSLEEFSPGEYELKITVRDGRSKKLDQKSEYFRVTWSEVAMLRNSYESIVTLLSYIAKPEERDTLEKTQTYEQRVEVYRKFWWDRDPSPGTPENEAQNEFFRRVRIANTNFTFIRQAGWRTDRGMIFVKHGEPDEFEDYPMEPNQTPFQIWSYYFGGAIVRFTFVDDSQDGDYRMVSPLDGYNLESDF